MNVNLSAIPSLEAMKEEAAQRYKTVEEDTGRIKELLKRIEDRLLALLDGHKFRLEATVSYQYPKRCDYFGVVVTIIPDELAKPIFQKMKKWKGKMYFRWKLDLASRQNCIGLTEVETEKAKLYNNILLDFVFVEW